MSKTGSVSVDPLFVGLTRPSMFLGVSTPFVLLNGFASMVYYIQSSDLHVIFLAVIIHLVGYVVCFKEPLFLELILTKMQKCNFCKNKGFHQANSYDPY